MTADIVTTGINKHSFHTSLTHIATSDREYASNNVAKDTGEQAIQKIKTGSIRMISAADSTC